MSETATTVTRPFHVDAGEGPTVAHLGALLTFPATSDRTGGRLWVQEASGLRGYASPRHRHTREDEAFYVLEGQVAFHVGEDVLTARAGSFVWAPRDVPHAFCVESARARFLAIAPGGDLDRFFLTTGEATAAGEIPPTPAAPPDAEALARTLTEYGVEITGPPPEPRDV